MTDKRISPLQWLSTKFASLNHSHSEYLTSHQDITGKEDKTNKSSSISTDTGSTTKYPTVKAIEDYAQPKGNYLTQHQSLTNYVQKSQTNGLLKNDGNVMTGGTGSSNYAIGNHTHSGYANSSHTHEISEITLNSLGLGDDTYFASYDSSESKFDLWGGLSLYNSQTYYYGSELATLDNLDNYLPSETVNFLLNEKQDTLVSGTSIKTINNQSLLGSGNISIDIEPLKQVAIKYFKQENFLNPNCWYDDGDNYTKPTYSNGTLSATGWGSRFYFKDGYELPNEYTLSFTLSSGGSPTLWVNETSITLGSNPNNISITSNNGNTSVTVNNSTNQTITGKMELLEIKRGQSSSISNFSFNGTYPSNNLWDKKQDILVSGTNLKTINDQSLLGSGNITISGGSGTVDSSWVTNSTNPVQSQLIKSALDNKEQTSNKVTSISSSSTDNQYPSAKCVYDEVDSLWDNIPNTNDFELVQCKVNDISTYTSDTDMYPSTKAVADYIDNVLPTNLSDLTDDINCVTTSSASSTTPLSDISGGSSGSSTNYARADHQHQLSDAYARSSHTHSAYVNPTIADNLTTNDSSQVLSAKQGKILNDLIGQAITYINQ